VRHLFVCTNVVASGKPACGRRGGDAILAAVQQKLLTKRATGVLATACGCLGPCFDGPNAVVYPDGVWYGGLDESDADAIVAHLVDGIVHEAKRVAPPGV
jgi:sirohydrochlorin cobaltochelatase